MDLNPLAVLQTIPESNESIICSDLSHQQVALISLRNSFLKKYVQPGSDQNLDNVALRKFLLSQRTCSRWTPDYNSYYSDIVMSAREKLHSRLLSGPLQSPVVCLSDCFDKLRPGPGASLKTKFTDFVGKVFSSKLSTYDLGIWEFYKQTLPTTWRVAEDMRERHYGGAVEVPASRLTFAPKSSTESRVINTEANINMMYQLALGTQIEAVLKKFYQIDLSKQPDINRSMAHKGSIDGSFGTIDLSSASDTISEGFVRLMLPPSVFRALDTVRAKCVQLPSGELLRLSAFSTMGNGFTFPLQTLLFASVVEAVLDSMKIPYSNARTYSVFGDDIICPQKAFHTVCKCLEWCGFTVNDTKSFNSGCFRESCGKDFFKGHDVRGVYLRKLSHETHVYSLFNRLCRYSIRNNLDLSATLRFVRNLATFRPVPFDESDAAGFKVPLALSGLLSVNGFVRYKAVTIRQRKVSTRLYEFNSAALMIGAVGGYITGRRARPNHRKVTGGSCEPTADFTIRNSPSGTPVSKIKRLSTSSWDWIPQNGLTPVDFHIALSEALN